MKDNEYQIIDRNDIPKHNYNGIGRHPYPETTKLFNAIPDNGKVLVKKCSDNKERKMWTQRIRAYFRRHNTTSIKLVVRGLSLYLFKLK